MTHTFDGFAKINNRFSNKRFVSYCYFYDTPKPFNKYEIFKSFHRCSAKDNKFHKNYQLFGFISMEYAQNGLIRLVHAGPAFPSKFKSIKCMAELTPMNGIYFETNNLLRAYQSLWSYACI